MRQAAPETQSVIVEREMPHAAEKVWRALTQAPLLEDWLMQTDFEPVVGRRFQFRTAPMPHWDGVVDGEVLAVEPHERLAYSWTSGGLRTVVTWTLTPTAAGVLVRMEQAGFGPGQEANQQGATYGWRRNLAALEATAAGLA